MAGPCSVESPEQIEAVRGHSWPAGGAKRSSRRRIQTPNFALQLSGDGRRRSETAARGRRSNTTSGGFSEVMDQTQIPMMLALCRICSRWARATCRTTICSGNSAKSRKPVLLKRGISATIEELLLSAEYIMAGGNYDVMLCERGIRTFDTYLRNTLDIAAIPVIKKLSHLPIVVDPSHGTGRRDKVAPMARAAVAAGADGLIIEVHNDPDKALSDGAQSLYPDQFEQLMKELRMIAPAVGRKI